jgi:hypothetical protein
VTAPAPLHGTPHLGARGFIVVFHPGTDPDAATDALAAAHGFAPKHVFRHALLGFAAKLEDKRRQRDAAILDIFGNAASLRTKMSGWDRLHALGARGRPLADR